MKHIKTLNTKSLQNTMKKGGCGECQTSCLNLHRPFHIDRNDSRRRAYQPRRNSPPELGNRLATRQMQDGFQTRPRGQAQI